MARRRSPFSLLKRGDIYYVRQWDPDREQYSTARSTGKSNKGEALLRAAEMLKQGLVPKTGQPLAVDYAIERLRNSGNSRQYIDESIASIEKNLLPCIWFSRLKIGDVKNEHLNRLVDYLKKQGMSPRRVNMVLAAIKPAFKAAYRRGYILSDPTAQGVDKLPEKRRKRGSLTADEIRRILAMPPCEDVLYKPLVVIAICTGMRKGELRALKWRGIDTKAGIISVTHSYTDKGGISDPKTESSIRELPLLRPIEAALAEIKAVSPYTGPDDLVFFREEKTGPVPISAQFANTAYMKILDLIGIDKSEQKRRHLPFHTTRHSFTTFCRTMLPDFIVGGMTGHTTKEMIDNYGHVGAEHLRTARDVLNAALSVKPEGDDKVH